MDNRMEADMEPGSSGGGKCGNCNLRVRMGFGGTFIMSRLYTEELGTPIKVWIGNM